MGSAEVRSAVRAAGEHGGGEAEKCAAKNADVNGDGAVDLSDAVPVLNFLFLGNPTELVPNCDPPELTARIQEPEAELATCRRAGLPDSGQTLCYDQSGAEIPCPSATFKGQGGAYATGCPSESRFVDNQDGTVTDNCTGLMWQQNTADVNGDGHIDDAGRLQWCDALAYCENLSFGGGVAAWDDWRLPNVRELQSIVDYGGRALSSIDPVFGAIGAAYWSSSSYALCLFAGCAWSVNFRDGKVIGEEREVFNSVRAVRNAQ